MQYIILLIVLLLSSSLTAVIYLYAKKNKVLDIPTARSSHVTPTPRGGGLAIVLTFSISIIILYYIDYINYYYFVILLFGGLIIAAIGIWDDHKHVSAKWRLLVHILVAVFSLYCLGRALGTNYVNGNLQFGWFVDFIVLIFIVSLINLYNFMDGIDGIASLETITVTISLAVLVIYSTVYGNSEHQHQYTDGMRYSLQMIIISLSVLGFLFWNYPPAKIFMGDVGSAYLGFILAIYTITATIDNITPVWVWFILLGVFIVDSSLTLFIRIITRQRWYEAHCSHAYQHAARRWGSHKKVIFSVLMINLLWLLPLAWLVSVQPDYGLMLTIVAYLPLFFMALKLIAGRA